jgi:hypothetical protein
VAVFYPFEPPTPYAYARSLQIWMGADLDLIQKGEMRRWVWCYVCYLQDCFGWRDEDSDATWGRGDDWIEDDWVEVVDVVTWVDDKNSFGLVAVVVAAVAVVVAVTTVVFFAVVVATVVVASVTPIIWVVKDYGLVYVSFSHWTN